MGGQILKLSAYKEGELKVNLLPPPPPP